MMLTDPLLVDRFEIERRIGAGGMGEVFRARDRLTGDPVAVKLIASSSSDPRDHRTARFVREVELLAKLSHPGIVRYITHGETPSGELFLVMEWLEGEDLQTRLARAPLTKHEAVKLTTRAAEALGAAHARGVVHRDLKPSNLFLPDGQIDQVKVLDFGIALREGRTQLTQTGMLLGTPEYMAPEQARSQGAVDARADVFALGCVLFQCLTGVPPFEGDSPAAVLGKILFGETPRLRALWTGAPEDLDALVAQMMSKDPAQRPNDGANLAAALAALGPLTHSVDAMPAAQHSAARPGAITGGERRLLSAVLVGPVAEDDAGPVAENDAPELDEATLRRTIRPYGGHLELLADGSTMVVLAGDHQAATDQAVQAARCALALHALTTNRPIAVAIGRADSTKSLPESEVIDRAARLLSHAARAPGDRPPIALDDMIAGLLDARFDVIEDDAAGLRLCGERTLAQSARTLLGRPTSCVGRDWELGALLSILDDCIDERTARAVIVTAGPGMGKSRLGTELVGRVQQRHEDVAIWIGRGDSLRAGSTLDLLAQALRDALGIGGGEPLPERWDKIRTRVAEHVPLADQPRVTEFLGELVGAPFPSDERVSAQLRAAHQDAQLMSEQMRNAWLAFLQAEASAHPVLLVLEDLHWGDFGTVRFIDAALRDRGDLPWMVLALARPEVFEVFPRLWAERQHVQEIRLKELGRKAGERLVRQVLGDSVEPDTIERLVKLADGNAFYLEELIRAVGEGKDKALPETVLAMVETRLGQLPVEARRVLRAASVFGEVSWESGVALLLSRVMGDTMVGEWAAELVEQEVLAVQRESRFPGERELRFRHALLREGAYVTLTEEDQRLGHRLAGEWLEQHGEGDPMVLAGHFERGGDRARAARYYLRAAEQACHVLDLEAAVARASFGLACAPTPELRLALLGIRTEAASESMQMLSGGIADAEELMRAAPRGSLPWTQALSMYFQGTMVAGRVTDLLAGIKALREVEPAPGVVERMGLAFVTAVASLDLLGRIPEGNAVEARFFAVVRPTPDRQPLARFWWNVLMSQRAAWAHEDPWLGLQHSDANQAIFELIGGERVFLNLHLYGGLNRWFLGALEPAERSLERIAAADEVMGIASSLRRWSLAWLRADRGALDPARVLASELREHGRTHHVAMDESRGRWVLAEVLRRMGDLEGAEREIQAALGTLIPIEQPGALATLSAIRLAQGRAEEARAAAEDAVSRCEAMGGCGLFRGAFVRLARVEALHATGAHEAARHAAREARARLLAIADRIADPAYRKSFLEEVPENARTLALARAWLGEAAPSP
ncbi:MAG TPA: protein kinase [Kofleriaceae bacterium]|nr:protein kinase [Kofleriaceae bacterium]